MALSASPHVSQQLLMEPTHTSCDPQFYPTPSRLLGPGLYLHSVSQVLPSSYPSHHHPGPFCSSSPGPALSPRLPPRETQALSQLVSSLPAALCSWPSHMPWSTGSPSLRQHNIGGKPPAQGGQEDEDNVVSAFENSLSGGKDRCLGLSAKR